MFIPASNCFMASASRLNCKHLPATRLPLSGLFVKRRCSWQKKKRNLEKIETWIEAGRYKKCKRESQKHRNSGSKKRVQRRANRENKLQLGCGEGGAGNAWKEGAKKALAKTNKFAIKVELFFASHTQSTRHKSCASQN